MRIALAQTNPTVGDIAGNMTKIIDAIDRAKCDHTQLIVFPELAIIGYPPKDLLLKQHALEQCELAISQIANHCDSITAIVGYPQKNNTGKGRPLYNSVAVLGDKKVIATQQKTLLPTYDVFDESRYFEPGTSQQLIEVAGVKLGISICEDIWNDPDMIDQQLYHDNPIEQLAKLGADVFINCSASPFVTDKQAFRLKLFQNAAMRYHLPLVYVNQVGGNDELIFDGNSCVINQTGKLIATAKDFEEDLVIVDLPVACEQSQNTTDPSMPTPVPVIDKSEMAAVYAALVLGLGDYCRKCGFKSAALGLSGGIDSAICACIAAEALGGENVTGIAMPSRYSSKGSKSDAQQLADNLKIGTYHTIPIEPAHLAMEQMLESAFKGTEVGIAEENIQARLRGVLLMAFSNKFGSLLITTGNKSEMAVGYCTLYGDMNGGLAILADVPKTMVYELARWINTPDCPLYQRCGCEPIPVDTITKPPSAELRPDQKDEDSLPPYAQLDQIVDLYVEREKSVEQIADRTGIDAAVVRKFVTMIDRNEYKRKQAAPVLKITGRAFGFGRRVPIAQRYDPTGRIE